MSATSPHVPEMVTKADREAAAAIADLCHMGFSAHYIRQGKHDDRPLTQAFARHRLAAAPQHATVEVEVSQGWRCFHCGDLFTDELCARKHFGRDEASTPACLIKGADGGLLRALRNAEEQADDAIQRMHAESTDAAVAYHRQRCRHTQALMAAEESGYEKGLADGRALAAAPQHSTVEVERLREALERADEAWAGLRQTQLAASAVGVELAESLRTEGYGLHLTLALRDGLAALTSSQNKGADDER